MVYFVGILCLSMLSAGAAPSVNIVVKAEDGRPLSGIAVTLAELERPYIDVAAAGVTDTQGRFALAFEDRESTRDGDRGYGVYRFVLTPRDRPWALSDLYVWYRDPADSARYVGPSSWRGTTHGESNWQYGERRVLAPGETVEWVVTLPEKRPVEVLVRDDLGYGIRQAEIAVSLDLEALSHTGFGGEIPLGAFTTGDDGRFTIPNAGDFSYTFDIRKPGYIAPHEPAFTQRLQQRLSNRSTTIIYHRLVNASLTVVVTDAASGEPIPGATILQVIYFPSTAQGGPIGKTNHQGRFHTDSFHPEHTAWIGADADGYALPTENPGVPYNPDRHEYTVLLSPAGSK